MLKTFFVGTFLLFLQVCSHAQVADSALYTPVLTLPTNATFFSVDQLKQIYTVSPTNELIKYDATGKEQFRYNNNTLGALTHIDVTNPFSILLFYGEFRTLIMLDRNLTETAVIDVYNLDVNEIRAVAQSRDNNLWLYDDLRFKLKKVNRQGNYLIESDDLSLLLNQALFPTFIIEKNNRVYVNDPNIGILVFDIFGKYLKTLERKGVERFQIIGEQLLYLQEQQLHSFHLQSLLETTIRLPKKMTDSTQIVVREGRLFWLEEGQLIAYDF